MRAPVPRNPVLVVDFGTSTSSAALCGTTVRLLKEPATGSWSWPSAVYLDGDMILVGTPAENMKRDDPGAYRAEFKRLLGESVPIQLGDKDFQPEDLVAELLDEFARQAAELLGGRRPECLVLTVPASYGTADPRRELMIAAGQRAGFTEVELLPEPVAAAFAPVAGDQVEPGSLILVYDFGGGTFDAALVRIEPDGNHQVLGHAALQDCGGRDVDALIRGFIEGQFAAPQADDTEWYIKVELTELARRAKHHLTDAANAREFFGPAKAKVVMTRPELTELARPMIDNTIRCCLDLLTSANVPIDDVTAVLLVGGSSRMPVVTHMLQARLGRPVRKAEDLATAVVNGAAEWAKRVEHRSGPPVQAIAGHRPLRWDLPGGIGRMVRWLVRQGDDYQPGEQLGVVRLSDGVLWRLLADDLPGTVVNLHTRPGDPVTADDWLATVTSRAAKPSPVRPRVEGALVKVVFSADGTEVIAATRNNLITFDSGTAEPRETLPLQGALHQLVRGQDRRVRAVAVDRGVETAEVITAGETGPGRSVNGLGPVNTVALNHDGTLLAVATDSGTTRIIELRNKRVLVTLHPGEQVRCMAFSPDGQRLVTAGDTRIRMWDAVTSNPIAEWRPKQAAAALAFSPDGRMLCTGAGGSIVAWESVGGQHLVVWQNNSGVATDLTFSPDGTRVAAACGRNGALIWDAATGEELASAGHDEVVNGVAFSPDGRSLALCVDSGAIHVVEIL
jgi:molecular chaperone DnaK